MGFKIAGHKVAAYPLVGVVKQLSIEPLVVHGQADGLPNTRVLKLGQTGVENEALKIACIAVLEFTLDQLAPVKCATAVGARPLARNKGLDEVEFARFECLELGRVVFVNLVGDAIEVEHAAPDVHVGSPPVRVANIGDVAAKIDTTDAVRA